MEDIIRKIGREELEILFQMSSSLSSTLELSKILNIIIESAKTLLKAEASSLLLLDETANELYFASATGDVSERLKNLTVPLDKGIAGACVRTGKPIMVNDTSSNKDFYPGIDKRTGFATKSIIAAPLIITGKTIGVIEVLNKKNRRTWTNADKELLIIIAFQAAQVIQNAQVHLQIREQQNLLRDEIDSRYAIISASDEFKEVLQLAEKVAQSTSTVLLLGENGTGKELIARYIHRLSPRKEESFIAVNCAAIPTTLLESELFGYEKGAFTGATSLHRGRFELAHKGTIFLDEIGDLAPETQSKLLRVIQEREFERLGGTKVIKVDVRVIAATNQNLEEKIAEKQFREDLFYRLNVFPIQIPPLRERKDDIPLLAKHFLTIYARDMNKTIKDIDSKVMQRLLDYPWPGNVRELQNVIERAVVLATGDTIDINCLMLPARRCKEFEISGKGLKEAVDAFKLNYIRETIEQCGGNQRKASKILKIQPSYLSRLLHKARKS
ncbi:MAG TPA: GAF domain-containing protein [candidate division WOR-3 bacterium]|uniref:GAF domain-containing protein n=1 Tax=candidate division WOR-3 bacterium TaxID=2052148 RepID=A0A9C9K0T5_UNCW3|nr:GAF domain-containing protein [candidate division WOR-3 bacterium]